MAMNYSPFNDSDKRVTFQLQTEPDINLSSYNKDSPNNMNNRIFNSHVLENPNRIKEQTRYPEPYSASFNPGEPESIRKPVKQNVVYNNNYRENNTRLINDGFALREYIGDRLKSVSNSSLNNFLGTIYNNFIELSDYPQLKHTPIDIQKLLTSPNLIMYTESKSGVMIGYTIGELMKLDDGRYVLFINYLYVGTKYRNNGLGTILLNKMIGYAKFKSMDAVMLIADTEDDKVMNFYLGKGFMYDQYLRRYDKYDVLTRDLN